MDYHKVKSVAKIMIPSGDYLQEIILETLAACATMVGSTLGPGGRNVFLERQETGMDPIITKDGVTVFRALGFEDSVKHVIMELFRSTAMRTATEAGDGPQPLWAKVLTPKGFVAMGDIRPGMSVCGTNGTIQEVLGVYGKGQKEIFKVTLTEGRVVECCEDHLWTVTTHYGSTKTLTTKEIAKDFKILKPDGYHQYRYYTPRTEVEFSEKDNLPLDPYLVGVLLGDGSLCDSGSIELSLGDSKFHILSKLALPKGISLKTTYIAEKSSYRVKIVGETIEGKTIRNLVDEVGIRNTDSDTKFIPTEYLMASKESRLALLQGLLDTDGHINVRGRFEFSTVSNQLAEDFKFLARSLGITMHIKLHTRENDEGSFSDKPIHRITELKGDRYGNKILNVEATGKYTEMQCIKVSNPDNLYITDGFVVTHNTTSSTILGYAFSAAIANFCKQHPHISPEHVIRVMKKDLVEIVEPELQKLRVGVNLGDEEGRRLAEAVACISANGDRELARATIKAFDIVGDAGNVTITERLGGSSKYEVDKIDGYPMDAGYDDIMAPFWQDFINTPSNQSCTLINPMFLVVHGRIDDYYGTLWPVMNKIAEAASDGKCTPQIVVCATGFGEQVLANLAAGMKSKEAIDVYPLQVPMTAMATGQHDALLDISALTNAVIFNGLDNPLANFRIEDLGSGPRLFEAKKFRSTIVGYYDSVLVEERAEQVERQLKEFASSEYDRKLLRERLAKLTSGIARLVVIGPNNGDIKERQDRADDAVCSVRAALIHGAVPGGGACLNHLSSVFLNLGGEEDVQAIRKEIWAKALLMPVQKLFENAGYKSEAMIPNLTTQHVYDILRQEWVDPMVAGIVDSLPAVLEALRSSIGIATRLGTSGGIVAYLRDHDLEKHEAKSAADFVRYTQGTL